VVLTDPVPASVASGDDQAMTDYTDQERRTLRTAAFGAVVLVSQADPGMLDMVKEAYAGSKAFAAASPELRDLLKSGGIPKVADGSPAEVESNVLAALSESTTILQAKGESELDGFRTAVTFAVDKVAAAAGGGQSQAETAAIGKVKTALGIP
jgi:hypothetical protein